MDCILKYFPDLSAGQIAQFEQLGPLYGQWNQKINVISRKDIENLYERHVLHSLSIAKVMSFKAGAAILDLGTGGGFPGLPLAILFPQTHVTLIDGTRKKIKVVKEIAQALQLENIKPCHIRAEELKQRFDFVVCRAVASLSQLTSWSRKLVKSKHQHSLPNGLIALKGGDIQAELDALPKGEYVECFPLSEFFQEEYFAHKYAIYVQGI